MKNFIRLSIILTWGMLASISNAQSVPTTTGPSVGYDFITRFDALDGQTISLGNPLTLTVAGYGDIRLSSALNVYTGLDSVVNIGINPAKTFLGTHILFGAGDQILMEFLGTDPLEVLNIGNLSSMSGDGTMTQNLDWDSSFDGTNIHFTSVGDYTAVGAAGLIGISFNVAPAPEPSGALLVGVAGMCLLARRRRR